MIESFEQFFAAIRDCVESALACESDGVKSAWAVRIAMAQQALAAKDAELVRLKDMALVATGDQNRADMISDPVFSLTLLYAERGSCISKLERRLAAANEQLEKLRRRALTAEGDLNWANELARRLQDQIAAKGKEQR